MSALAPFSQECAAGSSGPSPARRPRRNTAGRHRLRQPRAHPGADRVGKDTGRALWALDRARPGEGTQVLYVSPLKALNYDVERTSAGRSPASTPGCRSPSARGTHRPRSGPRCSRARRTSSSRRRRVALPAAHLARPRDAARGQRRHRRRGACRRRHEARAPRSQPGAPRATRRRAGPAHRPLGDAAPAGGDRALRLGRPAHRAGRRRHAQGARPPRRRPLEDMREPGEGNSIWPSIYPALELVREHRSTIVFVNNRRLAERLALRLNELAEGDRARPPRLAGPRAARRGRGAAQEGRDPVPRRHLLARARHRHGRRRPRRAGRVAKSVARGLQRSAAPVTASTRRPRAASSRSSGPICSSRPSSSGA